MLRCLILLLFSFGLMAADSPPNKENHGDFYGSDEISEYASLISRKALNDKNFQQFPRKKEAGGKKPRPKKVKINKSKDANDNRDIKIATNTDGLYFRHFDSAEVAQYLAKLEELSGEKSRTMSLPMTSLALRVKAFEFLLTTEVAPFVPLLKKLVEIIVEREEPAATVAHLALRIDPNCSNMSDDDERRFTQNWHDHGEADRYLFALTNKDYLTTMIKVAGTEKYIEKNALFYLPGPMMHRTPDAKVGKRIQLSIGLTKNVDTY